MTERSLSIDEKVALMREAFSLCDNAHAREAYGWTPQVDIETGLARVIEAECKMLAARDNA